MLAIKQEISHKRQRTQWFQHLRPFNQNELEVRMTDSQYSSIIWLTQGKYAIVDNEGYEALSRWSWYYHASSKGAIAFRKKVGGKILMHRLIMDCPEGKVVDHINRQPHDNRKANLRICSQAENSRNRIGDANSRLPYKGVVLNRHGTYTVKVSDYVVGNFHNAELAAKMYDIFAEIIHAEYYRPNLVLSASEKSELFEYRQYIKDRYGITFCKVKRKWMARHVESRKIIHIGYFTRECDAILAKKRFLENVAIDEIIKQCEQRGVYVPPPKGVK